METLQTLQQYANENKYLDLSDYAYGLACLIAKRKLVKIDGEVDADGSCETIDNKTIIKLTYWKGDYMINVDITVNSKKKIVYKYVSELIENF